MVDKGRIKKCHKKAHINFCSWLIERYIISKNSPRPRLHSKTISFFSLMSHNLADAASTDATFLIIHESAFIFSGQSMDFCKTNRNISKLKIKPTQIYSFTTKIVLLSKFQAS